MASVTNPAPPRSAADAQRIAAPDMPRLPATTSTWPNMPLWLSAGRRDSTGRAVTISGGMDGLGPRGDRAVIRPGRRAGTGLGRIGRRMRPIDEGITGFIVAQPRFDENSPG